MDVIVLGCWNNTVEFKVAVVQELFIICNA